MKLLSKLFKYNKKESVEKSTAWRIIESLTVTGPVFFSFLGFFSAILLLLSSLSPLPVIFFAVVPAILLTMFIYKAYPAKMPGSLYERRILSVVVVIGVVFWVGINMYFSSENVYIHKDPGIYSTAATWLTKNDNLEIESSDNFGNSDAIFSFSSGVENLNTDRSRLYVQAPHYFPSLLSFGGRIFGAKAVFYLNSVLGGFALLAVFGVSKFFLKPRWAAFAPLLLALSLPMIYFTRDTYTEPLTIMLTFAGIASVLLAHKNKTTILWLLSGVISASGVLVRVDSYLVLISLLFSVILILLDQKIKLRQSIFNYLAFLLGAVTCAFIGWLDLTELSAFYYNNLHTEITSQIYLLIVLSVIGLPIIYLGKKYNILNRIKNFKLLQNNLNKLVAITFLLIFSYLVTRPLWLQTHKVFFNNYYVESLQTANGLQQIDGTLSYAELSHLWIVWYLGLAVFILGFIGAAIALRNFIRKIDMTIIPLIVLFFAMSLLYFNFPNITPDQIWASRRFLPVIFPAFCIFALFAVQHFYEITPKFKLKNALFIIIIAIMCAGPLELSRRFIIHKEFTGFYNEIHEICSKIPDNSAVLLVGTNGKTMLQPIRAHCDIPAERISTPKTNDLRDAKLEADKKGLRTIIILRGYEFDLLPRGSKVDIATSTAYQEIERTLVKRPENTESFTRVTFIAEVDKYGNVVRVLE